MSTALGGAYVNDFNRFGRLYRVYVQAEADYRRKPQDIGDTQVLSDLDATVNADDGSRMTTWRREWLSLDRRVVPMLVLPDGYVSRGLGALTRLADLIS